MFIRLDAVTVADLRRNGYLGAIVTGEGPRQWVEPYSNPRERQESVNQAEHFGHKWREARF